MTVHPVVRFAAQALGAVGGAALVDLALGTTLVVTTSYLTALIAFVVWVLLLALGAYVGVRTAAYACDKLSDKAFEGYGNTLGSALGSVRNLFSKKAA